MRIAWRHLGPGVDNGDQGLGNLFVTQASGSEHGSRGSTVRSFLDLVTAHLVLVLGLSSLVKKKPALFLVRVFQVTCGLA
jgi:hypothetical protein